MLSRVSSWLKIPVVGLALTLAARGLAEPAAPVLWYTAPAAKWESALPLGNGHIGAMVFGGTADERIQFNESTLWTGQPHDYVRAGAIDALPEIRRLLAEGKVSEAAALGKQKFLSDPVRQKAYQPFGDIRLRFAGHEAAIDYRRDLDLSTAIARVTYRVGETTFTREVFTSHPANALVVRLTADKPGQLTFTLKLTSPHKNSATTVSTDLLILTGEVQKGGLRFESRLRALATGGKIEATADSLAISGADSVTLELVAATSFQNYEDISADPAARAQAALKALDGQSYDKLRAAHLADHRALFSRVALDLGTSDRASLPTDQRIAAVKRTGLAADPALAALHFQYGRYLLIASSRPGGQPANLQGIWNELLDPPWESKWTTNINLEMNYWPAEVANLSECAEPLFGLIDDLAVSGARTAKEQYGAGGWVLHHNTDLWRGTAPINNIDGIWPTGGAWLCYHLWEHWLFTGDREFLAKRAYPIMRSASQFFIDTLVKDERTGWLVTTPSFSPEQGGMTAGPAMDIQLIRALFNTTLEAASILKTDTEFAQKLSAIRAQLPPNQIGKLGQLQEWLTDEDRPENRPNNNHRHMSPLWALYPGADITPAEPKVFDAAKLLLKWRGDGSTGWSYAWRMPLWARVGDGDYALRQFDQLVAKRTQPNLLDLCGPFQIDGNFGAAAGVAEMLLQSQQFVDGKPVIELLPALPKAWATGSVAGLRARGGFTVDLAWEQGTLTRAVVHTQLGRPFQLRYAGQTLDVTLPAGRTVGFDTHLRPIP